MASERKPVGFGLGKHLVFRLSGRVDRLNELEQKARAKELTKVEQAELSARLSSVDSYTAAEKAFTDEHKAFKQAHSAILATLLKYTRAENGAHQKVFLLDGASGSTCEVLAAAGVDLSTVFVANRHKRTCDALREKFPALNVELANAAAALGEGGPFARVVVSALYLDACGGAPTPLVEILEAALARPQLPPRIAVGFSILGGARTVADRELTVCRGAVSLAKKIGGYRVVHVVGFIYSQREGDGGGCASKCSSTQASTCRWTIPSAMASHPTRERPTRRQ